MKRITKEAIRHHLLNNPVSDWVWSDRTLMLYRMDMATAARRDTDPEVKCNSQEHLAKFEQTENWLTPEVFREEANRRIEAGQFIYSIADETTLLQFGWMACGQKTGYFPYVDQDYEYPEGSIIFYNFYSHPRARGRGLYQRNLSQMMKESSQMPGMNYIYGAVEAPNPAPHYVLQKLGMKLADTLYRKRRFGLTEKGVIAGDRT